MCVLDCRCMCGSTVGVWRRAVGPADIRLLLGGLADGRSGRGKHEGIERRGWRNRGMIRGTEGRKEEKRGAEEEEQRGWKREDGMCYGRFGAR